MFHLNKGVWIAGIPFFFSVMAVITHCVAMFVIYILVHFVILKITPAFKHYENIGMFLIVAFSSIPINIYIFKVLIDTELFFGSLLVIDILRGMSYYIVLLSIEEIIMGILTRCVWKKQYKFPA